MKRHPSLRRHAVAAAMLAASALALAGCTQDPYRRPFTWSPSGVNDANLRTMIADPHDLVSGRGDDRSLAVEAAPPVQRLLSGQRLPLSTESASGISNTAPTAPSSPGSAGSSGGGQ